jgi:hypothetical protein
LVFNASGWGVHIHCGAWHVVTNNVFAGNAAVLPPASFPQYTFQDYAAEPFCNFQFHPHAPQRVQVTRNIFDQSVAPSVGIGRTVSILNNNTVQHQGYGNTSNAIRNATLDYNLYSCWDAVTYVANGVGSGGGGGGGGGDGRGTIDAARNGCRSDFPGDTVAGRTFAGWKAAAHQDEHSVVGSPGFGDDAATTLALRRDFRVDPARSEAVRAIGFEPLDARADAVGPRSSLLSLAHCHNFGGDVGVWWQGCSLSVE